MSPGPLFTAAWLLVALVSSFAQAETERSAESAEVTILSSNLANGPTIGEWGFSALVEVDGSCLLFDTGNYPDTVLRNIQVLGLDLSCVTDVVLSHWHPDHMGGLVTLFEDTRARSPDSIQRVHVAEGFFLPRRLAAKPEQGEINQMIDIRDRLANKGVEFRIYSEATEILPSVWVTGPIERNHEEKTYPHFAEVHEGESWKTDYVPDSQGLVVVTDEGPIVLLGCGHSGSVNLLEQVQREIQDDSIHALMGGMHLFSADDATLRWTADKLNDVGIEHLMAGHCTGVEPMFRLREGLDLDRQTAVMGAVGSRFVLGEGIHPTAIAQ
ncbi:MAG: MBL fold metallo-hydrolase [Gammaproteobacteria bacterium]|nr:MAG: MBL fold metallo-hydrolase [Gammaproteobacteria bacterium]